MDGGWIKLHRSILKWEWIDKPEMVSLFIYLLSTANHQKKSWHGQTILPGQTIIGTRKLPKTLGISRQTLRTCLTRLKSTQEITLESTHQYTIITIVNWEQYQSKDKKSTHKLTHKLTHDQPTTNPQLTTPKECKEGKNDKKVLSSNEDGNNINKLLKEFESVNPTINYGNKTQRKTLQELLDKFGYEKLLATIQFAVSVQGKTYTPTITTPIQLKNKLGDLMVYYQKENDKKPIIQSL